MMKWRRFLRSESGVTAIEYAVLAAFISLVAFGALTEVGSKISGTFTTVFNNFTGSTTKSSN